MLNLSINGQEVMGGSPFDPFTHFSLQIQLSQLAFVKISKVKF